MSHGGSHQIGSTTQSAVSSFGPIGAAIGGVSTAATGTLDKSDSPLAGALSSGVFNPSSNLDFALDSQNPGGQRALALLNPAFAGFFEKKNKNKKNAAIEREDPRQTERLLELDRIAKNIQAGTDAGTQTAIRAGERNVAQTQSRIGRVTGGAGGATVDAFLKAERAGDIGANQAFAQGQARLPFFLSSGQQLQNRISDRSLQLDLLDRAQSNAEIAQAEKEANINRQGALGTAISTGAFDEGNIRSIGNLFKSFGSGAGGGNAGTGGSGFINPNESLNQTLIDPNQKAPGVINDISGGNEVTNLLGGLPVSSFN